MLDWISDINWTEILLNWGIIIIKLLVLIFIYFIVKSIGQRAIHKAFKRKQTVEGENTVSLHRRKTLQAIVGSVFSYFLLFIFIGVVFELFGLDIKALLAGAGIVGLAIGFGAQGLVSDVVTGFFILLERQIDIEDYVTIADYEGIVEDISLRTTRLRGFDGTLHYIPNREIASVSNHSRGNMRALVDIGISYEDDIDRAVQVIQAACDELAQEEEAIVEGPDVVGVQSLDSSEVVLRIICKTKNMEQWGVERKLRKMLKEALEKHDIYIPYPHQVNVEKQLIV